MRLLLRVSVVVLLNLASFAPVFADEVRFITYNVESYNDPGSTSYNALLRVVQALDPDILLTQEAANNSGRAAFETAMSARGLTNRFLGAADGGGNREQVFSRWSLSNGVNIFAGGFSRPSVRVDVDTDPANPGPELRVYNVHFKSGFAGSDWDMRAAMAEAIRNDIEALWATRPDFRIVFAGDCNEELGDTDLATLYEPQFNMNYLTRVDPFTGSPATRLASGRSLDHFILSDTAQARVLDRFIFNSTTWTPLPPPALFNDSIDASDHLCVVMDIDVVRFIIGDVNNDGAVNTFDIDPFVLALSSPQAFRAAYPWIDLLEVADANQDGAINTFDIDPFVALLTQ